jgi:hypothetical protein
LSLGDKSRPPHRQKVVNDDKWIISILAQYSVFSNFSATVTVSRPGYTMMSILVFIVFSKRNESNNRNET